MRFAHIPIPLSWSTNVSSAFLVDRLGTTRGWRRRVVGGRVLAWLAQPRTPLFELACGLAGEQR